MPEVLRKYVPGAPEFIEYTKDLPKDTTSAKAKGKAAGSKSSISPLAKETTEGMEILKV